MTRKQRKRLVDALGGPWVAANDDLAMAWAASLDELGIQLLDRAGRPVATASIALAFHLAHAFSQIVISPERANSAPDLGLASPDYASFDADIAGAASAEAPSAQILHSADEARAGFAPRQR